MDGPAAPRKRPWELHAIACLFLIAIGAAASMGTLGRNPGPEQLIAFAGMTFSQIGLFRGSRLAWRSTLVGFGVLTVGTFAESARLVSKYGLIAHWKLLLAYGETALCSATFGLLLSLRLRRAIPPPAAPLAEDLPAFHALLKVAAPIVFLLAGLFSMATPLIFSTGRNYSERYSSSSIRTMASAEADFRANDRDWNHFNDFWTGDVAGLYGIVPAKLTDEEKERYKTLSFLMPDNDGTTPIKLIELSTALADGNPIANAYPPVNGVFGTAAPKGEGWYAALRADRSVSPPEPYGMRNTTRFGFIAYS